MKKTLFVLIGLMTIGEGLFAQNAGTDSQSGSYKLGDTGPAGGLIFYDKGVFSEGWRYLEAAPEGSDFTAKWGAYRQNVAGTGTTVGSGKRNTQLIVGRLKQLGENDRAAQICTGLEINGFKDWFLPCKEELDFMYKNLKQKGLGGFGNVWYWSSSQNSNGGAWVQYFSRGRQLSYRKNYSLSVRAIRAFE